MRYARLLSLLITFVSVVSVFATTFSVQALTGSDFNAGRIIDDAVFTNKSTMTVAQIQQFLNAKVPSCEVNHSAYNASNPPPYTCLKDYQENTTTGENNFGRYVSNNPYQVPGGKSAAQIIWEAGQTYNINPQVLIVLLQKEQALVTDTWPLLSQFTKATGYLCPDTAACNSNAGGFSKQVFGAAWQFRNDLNGIDTPGFYSVYGKGLNNIRLNPNAACGTKSVFIENQATAVLYKYTPYTPNDAALAVMNDSTAGGTVNCGAYGNRNFFWYFTKWFGSTILPVALQSNSTGAIYLNVSGYKILVTQMAILQDYGINPASIQIVDQSVIDNISTPSQSNGISDSLGSLVKSTSDTDEDGAAVYLVSVGKKYQIQSMQQFYEFGLNQANIKYLPMSYIYTMQEGGMLSNFITSPLGSVFKVSGGQKNIILDYATYITLNPSDKVTPFSYYLVDSINSSAPISNKEMLIKYPDSDEVFLYLSGTYYAIPSYDTYRCWGFDSTLNTPIYRVPARGYIAPISASSSLSCLVGNPSGSLVLLNRSNKYRIPADFGFSNPTSMQQIIDLASRIATAPTDISLYIKGKESDGVWKLDAGKRRLIPTYSNYQKLNIRSDQLTIIDQSTLNAIPIGNILLAEGTLVNPSGTSAVYAIKGDTERILYDSSAKFLAYGNSWANIEKYDTQLLDNAYPFKGKVFSDYAFIQNSYYIINQPGCYKLNSSDVTALNLGALNIATNYSYDSSIFRQFNYSTCSQISKYVKTNDSSLVYELSNNTKVPYYTWTSLINSAGTSTPNISLINSSILNNIPFSP